MLWLDMLAPFVKPAAAVDDLSFALVALLRAEGHLCNVLTHIASGDWRAVEQAIVAILSPRTSSKKLSDLARNILELACDNRGVTGRIMGPFFFDAILRIAGKAEGKRLEKKLRRLRRRISSDGQLHLVAHPPRAGKSSGALRPPDPLRSPPPATAASGARP
jgi:hypothetical protein